MPTLGDTVAGRYRIVRRIGDGGMGVVFEADDLAASRHVALKFLHDNLRTHPVIPKRFVQEAIAARALTTPHAVRIDETGEHGDDKTPYLVMELLAGDDLGKLARRFAPLEVERALSLVDQACEALADAHAHGIVHRDLKPENVFVVPTPDGELVKLLDFGISKIVSRGDGAKLTQTGMTVGTPHYMAPEQLRGAKDLDGRADVYAIGVLLYEILAGKRPYDGATYEEVILKVVTEMPPPLAAARPDLPPALVDVVAHAMERDKDRRVPSMQALRLALAPFWSRRRLCPSGLPIPDPSAAVAPAPPAPVAPAPVAPVAAVATPAPLPTVPMVPVSAPPSAVPVSIPVAPGPAPKKLSGAVVAAIAVSGLVVALGVAAGIWYALSGSSAAAPPDPVASARPHGNQPVIVPARPLPPKK